jgi:hypothetical protein
VQNSNHEPTQEYKKNHTQTHRSFLSVGCSRVRRNSRNRLFSLLVATNEEPSMFSSVYVWTYTTVYDFWPERRCALPPSSRDTQMQFFFFFFFFKVTVNGARLGRRPVPPPIAKIEHLRHIGDTRLLFGGRIRRARGARKPTKAHVMAR